MKLPGRNRLKSPKFTIWLLVAAGIAVVGLANTHLVYVAITSEPDCVAPPPDTSSGIFRAAKSAC